MKIKFCGAAQDVTGSCHLLTLDNGYQILFDCGMYQGHHEISDKLNHQWLFDPAKINCLLLSHAHIDHCGRIPFLVKSGFKGKIFCTHATKDLAKIMLLDSAKIQMRDAEYANKNPKRRNTVSPEPLYNIDDVEQTLSLLQGIDYDKTFSIGDNVSVIFEDSGHIIGSANITVKISKPNGKETLIGFSGDIGRPNRPIIKDPESMKQLDYLLCESTYGGIKHQDMNTDEMRLLDIIKETCLKQKGKLLIPAFSVGRTQEIVYLLDKFEGKGLLPKIPVFVDSPMSVDATEIYRNHIECLDDEIKGYMLTNPDPFGFKQLKYIQSLDDSKALNVFDGPAIIISASGMITAGRILHHIFNNIEKKNTTILFVGFCAPGTLGDLLRNGTKRIHMFGEEKRVMARIEVMDSFSAHADEPEIIQFLKTQNPAQLKTLFLVHGEKDRQDLFKESLNKLGFQNIMIPKLGEEVTLE